MLAAFSSGMPGQKAPLACGGWNIETLLHFVELDYFAYNLSVAWKYLSFWDFASLMLSNLIALFVSCFVVADWSMDFKLAKFRSFP